MNEKTPIILLLLNRNYLSNAIRSLNWNNALGKAVVMEADAVTFVTFDDKRIPLFPYGQVEKVLSMDDSSTLWLVYGYNRDVSDAWKMAKFLMAYGIERKRIINFSVDIFLNRAWFGNLRLAERQSLDFFSTGISYTEVGLELSCFPGLRGINLACSSADLRNNLATAKHVLEQHPKGSCKFVLIGLAPYSLHFDNRQAFFISPRDVQFSLALDLWDDSSPVPRALLGDRLPSIVASITEKDASPDFAVTKRQDTVTSDEIVAWEEQVRNQDKKYLPEVFNQNVQILEEYIDLCHAHGTYPVVVIWPFAPILRQKYPEKVLALFRQALGQLMKYKEFLLLDFFPLQLSYDCFYNLSHLNRKGAMTASRLVHYWLCRKGVIPFENFCKLSYSEIQSLREIIGKDVYNRLLDDVFHCTEKRLASNKRLRVGFILYDASMWCGDDLYHLFERDRRYEPMVCLCLRTDKKDSAIVRQEHQKGLEQFRAKGLSVIGVEDDETPIPKMDIMIYLTPYDYVLPKVFNFSTITLETLIAHIPYAFSENPITPLLNAQSIARVSSWRDFFDARMNMEWITSETGNLKNPRAFFSGLPKLDWFYADKRNMKPSFTWKGDGIRKKVIYAPHWSIQSGMMFATFQHNFRFMYEYAKEHKDISWVLKPHPNLMFAAVECGVFPSEKAFKKYIAAWEALPNARVITGAYYHEIFETSDGMILDSGSFIFEYQYTHKPFLFLTRETQRFNPFAQKLMETLYKADGRDFTGIDRFVQDVLLGGNDYMYERRLNFFREHLDYKAQNHMTASEYIFKSIDRGITNAL